MNPSAAILFLAVTLFSAAATAESTEGKRIDDIDEGIRNEQRPAGEKAAPAKDPVRKDASPLEELKLSPEQNRSINEMLKEEYLKVLQVEGDPAIPAAEKAKRKIEIAREGDARLRQILDKDQYELYRSRIRAMKKGK